MSVRLKTVWSAGFLTLLLAGTLSVEATRPDSYPPGPGEEILRPDGRDGEELRTLAQTTRAKNRIAEEVVRRRLGLLEGAAALRAVDASWPARGRVSVGRQYPRCSEEEAYCRAMIGWVGPILADWRTDPALPEELQAELRRRLNGPEPLRLPEVDLKGCLPPELLPPARDGGRQPEAGEGLSEPALIAPRPAGAGSARRSSGRSRCSGQSAA